MTQRQTGKRIQRVDNVEGAIVDNDPIVKDWGNPFRNDWQTLLNTNDKPMTKSQTIAWAIKKMAQMQEDIDRKDQRYTELYKCYRDEIKACMGTAHFNDNQ